MRQRFPAVGVGVPDTAELLLQGFGRRLVEEEQQHAEALAVARLQRHAADAGRPPLGPAVGDFRRRFEVFPRQPLRPVARELRLQPAAGALQPDQVGRILGRPRQPGHAQQIQRLATAGEHQRLVEGQQRVEVVGHAEGQRLQRVGFQRAVAQRRQSGQELDAGRGFTDGHRGTARCRSCRRSVRDARRPASPPARRSAPPRRPAS
ncbi:hypothetical protein D3C76_855830 [compost metagenome]